MSITNPDKLLRHKLHLLWSVLLSVLALGLLVRLRSTVLDIAIIRLVLLLMLVFFFLLCLLSLLVLQFLEFRRRQVLCTRPR